METQIVRHTGRRTDETFSSYYIADPYYVQQLKMFNSNLDLSFNHLKQRWEVIEFARDGSGVGEVFLLEDEEGNPKQFGNWVFAKLSQMQANTENIVRVGADNWLKNVKNEEDRIAESNEEKIGKNNVERMKEDRPQWRRFFMKALNLPYADATAGYPKLSQYKNKQKELSNEIL